MNESNYKLTSWISVGISACPCVVSGGREGERGLAVDSRLIVLVLTGNHVVKETLLLWLIEEFPTEGELLIDFYELGGKSVGVATSETFAF